MTPIIQCLASMVITSTLVHTDLHHRKVKPLPFVYPHVEHLPDPRRVLHRFLPNSTSLTSTSSSSSTTVVDQETSAPQGETNNAAKTRQVDEGEKGRKGFKYYYWMLVRFIFEGTENNMLAARLPLSHWFGRLLWTAAQGALIGIVFGFPIWCLAIVILGPIYKNDNVQSTWAPQIIKAVYGAIVGWVTNPVIALLALGSQADSHLMVVEDEEEIVGVDGRSVAEGQIAIVDPTTGTGAVHTIAEDEEVLGPSSPSIGGPSSPSATMSRRLQQSPTNRSITLAPSTTLAPPVTPRTHRTNSNASLTVRPPLTANVSQISHISALPTPQPPTPGAERLRPDGGDAFNLGTLPRRPRGLTASSHDSQRSYSYVLGGTGGRAQRPRASSRVSNGPPISTPMATASASQRVTGVQGQFGQEQDRPPVWDVFGSPSAAGRATGQTQPGEYKLPVVAQRK